METESRIQQQIVMHVRAKYQHLMIYSVPNESANAREQMRKKQTGLLAGVADLGLMLPGGLYIFIEVKALEGKQSPKQKKFEIKALFLGFNYHVVRSVEDVEILLQSYGQRKTQI